MAPRDPLNPSLGDWVYLQAHVGTPYGAAGSTFGHEFTPHIAELVQAGYLTLTRPPLRPEIRPPGPLDTQVATVAMVRDLVLAYFGGYDGYDADYQSAVLSDRLLEQIDARIARAVVPQPGIFSPERYGARRNGEDDDAPAINAALAAAAQWGGTVDLTPGIYGAATPIGLPGEVLSKVHLRGLGEQAARIKALDGNPLIAHAWQHSRISGVHLDAALGGSPAVSAHFDKVVFADNLVEGWLGSALRLNDGTYGDLGLLNYILRNHIVQSDGVGVWTSYRFIDSWIAKNNIGSTGANVSLEGGPVRVLANHLNGAPTHNVELRGNKRITIADNICEGAGLEAIIYTMPPWLDSDAPQIQITTNAISNGGKHAPGTLPAIGFYGVAANRVVSGLSAVGNIIASEDPGSGWNYAVLARYADLVSATGNQWGPGTGSPEHLARQGGSATTFVAAGNAGGDLIKSL